MISSSTMVLKRKPSRKEKRLQKKLKRLEEELSSEDEDGQEKAQQRQASKKSSLQDTARAAGPTRALDSTEYHDDKSDDENEDIDGGSDASSSSGAGQEGDESDAGMESFDEDVGGREDDEVMSDGSRGEGPTRPHGGQKDGMADVMARILNQQVNKKAPVLAKRRTALMKETEEEKKARARAKTAAERKRATLNHQLYVPDHTDAEKERQLKRIATRGVVALFNAVTKARQVQEEKGGGSGPGRSMDVEGVLSFFPLMGNGGSRVFKSACCPWLR
jgi:hypothetical protein